VKELLEYLARALVDERDQVQVLMGIDAAEDRAL
jgi:predicted RNA-binding protein YlqC (UPF0109 family)